VLQAWHETEYFHTFTPADHNVSGRADLYLRLVSQDTHAVLVEVTQLGAFGSHRVALAAVCFFLIFGAVLSEVINRVYATMVGAILVAGLNALVYDHKQVLSDSPLITF
jgi:hypothetical protein